MSSDTGWGGPNTPEDGPGGPGDGPQGPGGHGPGPGGPGAPGAPGAPYGAGPYGSPPPPYGTPPGWAHGPGPYGGPQGGGWRPGGPYGPYNGPGWGYVPTAPKPGVIPLRPLNVGDIINGVFGTLKRYVKPLYVPLLITLGASAVLMGMFGAVAFGPADTVINDARAIPDYTPGRGMTTELIVLGGVGLLLALVCYFACFVVAATVSTTVVRHAVLGQKVTVRQVWDESRPHLWRVAWDNLLLTGASLLVAAVVLGLAIGVGVAEDSPAVFLLIGLLAIPLVGFSLYVGVRLVLMTPVLVVENERPIAAIRRAWRLNEGAWWRSLGIPYLINLIGSFAGQIIMIPFVVVGMVAMISSIPEDGGDSTVPVGPVLVFYVAMWVGAALISVLTAPLTPLTNALLYVDRRIRRESLDIALAGQAARAAADAATPPAAHAPPAPPAPEQQQPEQQPEPSADAEPPVDLVKDPETAPDPASDTGGPDTTPDAGVNDGPQADPPL